MASCLVKKNIVDIGPVVLEYKAMSSAERASPRGKFLVNQIVIKYLPLVKSTAERMSRTKNLPPSLRNLDDMIQAGYLGALKAIEKFDPEHKGSPRSVGSLFTDCVRWWVTREAQLVVEKYAVVHKARKNGMTAPVTAAADAFRAREGREASHEDLGVPANTWSNWRNVPHCVALEGGTRVYSRHVLHPIRVSLSATMATNVLNPEEAVSREQLLDILGTLTSVEKDILHRSTEGETALEIAEACGVDANEVADFLRDFRALLQ